MTKKDNSERIEKFFRDQMTPEENDAFLKDLKDDKELRDEAQMMALMIKEMKEEQARRCAKLTEDVMADQPAAAAKVTEPEEPAVAAAAKHGGFIRWSLSIAAMFILIFGATWLLNRPSDTDKLFNEYYTAYTIQGTPRGGDSDVGTQLATLFNQVGTAEDITPVINELQLIYDSIDSEYEYSLYADDITWYLALAYIKDHKLDKAKELLLPLADKGEERVRQLIESIDSQ